MSISLLASACIAASVGTQYPDYIGRETERNNLIINAEAYRANTVDAGRAQSGRVWIGTADRRDAAQNLARYGASADVADEIVMVRVDKTGVAINPWQPIHKQGLQRHERARVVWLKEQGYTHKVRTHININFREAHRVDAKTIKPSAVIRFQKADDGPMASAE